MRLSFSLLRLFDGHTAAIHFVIILIFALATTFLIHFLITRLQLNVIVALGIGLLWTISHINFYPIYTLSGIGDLIFIIFLFLTLHTYHQYIHTHQQKNLLFSQSFFALSMFTKEIFISIPIILIAMTLIDQKYRSKWHHLITLFVIPTIIYYIFKFSVYQVSDPAYQYQLSLSKLFENCKLFILWTFNYPYGWQMGTPLPVSHFFRLMIIINALLVSLISMYALKTHIKKSLVPLVWILAGLLPFLFLNRVLVYYLNITLLGVLLLVGVGLKSISRKYRFIAKLSLVSLIILNLYISFGLRQQWLTYSFVANAQETAQHFTTDVIFATNWDRTNTLCITNLNGDANWAIYGGKIINYYLDKSISIYTSTDSQLDLRCQSPNSVIFTNDARKFKQRS
jgi:hypothetical protein